MNKIINASLLLLLLTGTSAQAATVIFDGASTTAIGIEDLTVNGTDWDVSFVIPEAPAEHTLNECDGLFTNAPCDPFLSTTGAATLGIATTAANAIKDAFTADGAESVLDTATGKTSVTYNVPYADELGDCSDGGDAAYCVTQSSYFGFNIWLNVSSEILFPTDISFAMAKFTPASNVPVPPAAYLFATGLGLLGSRLRRRRREGEKRSHNVKS